MNDSANLFKLHVLAGFLVLITLGLATLLLPTPARADIIHPAYLWVQEIEPGQFDILWKTPLRYNLRLPIEPVFPAHCRVVSERSVEEIPGALVERWRMDCGPRGLDGETIEITGLQLTIMDVFVRIELLDGRIYEDQLRASVPRYTVSLRQPFHRIAGTHLMFGLKHVVGQIPVMLAVFALVLFAGLRMRLAAALTTLALGYAGGFIANAFGAIGAASDWGVAACALSAFTMVMTALTTSKKTGYAGIVTLVFLWLGILLGSTLGGDWSRAGLAYGDIPLAGVALFAGVWLGLGLLASVPLLVRLIHRDFNGDRLPPLASLPAYGIGIVAVYLMIEAGLNLASGGVIQPDSRPESLCVALATGILVGRSSGRRPLMTGLAFLGAGAFGLYAGTSGIDLPYGALAIPLSLALLGITLLLSCRRPGVPGLALVCFSGLFHGWINGRWLTEHVSASLPSAVGGMVLLTGLVMAGIMLRRSLKPARAVTLDVAAGAGLVAGAFIMRLAGYRATAFQEISVGAAGGAKIPVLSAILLAFALIITIIALRKGTSTLRAPRFALPWTLLLIIGLIAVPYGTFALSGGAATAEALSEEDARELIAGLLANTYRAVNLKGEEEIYDRLSMSVDGDLVEKLYLESRKRAAIPSQADAEAKLIDVQVTEILKRGPAADGAGYSFTTQWQVAGTIRHWAHKHNRLNRYSGVLTIRAVDEVWKLYDLELLDEARL
jgi:hydrogenase/urease accessory protein HupE